MRIIHCDGKALFGREGVTVEKPCDAKTPLQESKSPATGWTTDSGKDYCPKCSAQAKHLPKPKMSEDEKLIRRLLGRERGLNEKETDFIEDMGRRVIDERRDMTPDQRKWAQGIDDRLDR